MVCIFYKSCLFCSRPYVIEELIQCREFYASQNRLLKLLFALCNVVAAHSELVCYFIIVLNNVVTASVISLVLPVLIFLWAMLSIPRPSKRFWMTAIVYTEVGRKLSRSCSSVLHCAVLYLVI